LIISADNFEDTELLVRYYRLKAAGVEVIVAALGRGAIKGKHGYDVAVDKTLDEVNPDDYLLNILRTPISINKLFLSNPQKAEILISP
jgi:protease I